MSIPLIRRHEVASSISTYVHSFLHRFLKSVSIARLQNSTYFKTGCSIVFSIHSCVDFHESVFAELQDFALGCCSSQRFSEQVKEPLVSLNRWENIFLVAQMNRISVYKRSSVAHSQSHRFFLVWEKKNSQASIIPQVISNVRMEEDNKQKIKLKEHRRSEKGRIQQQAQYICIFSLRKHKGKVRTLL